MEVAKLQAIPETETIVAPESKSRKYESQRQQKVKT
jgi:hypothetical protein